MRAVLRLEGEGVREVLLKGSSLDLLSDDYAPGTVRRMRFAEIAALLHVVEDKVFDVYVFRSYADYAWDFMLATARAPAAVKLFGSQELKVSIVNVWRRVSSYQAFGRQPGRQPFLLSHGDQIDCRQ